MLLFKNYIDVKWTPASIVSQFAQIVFITHENTSNYVSANSLKNFVDTNKFRFVVVCIPMQLQMITRNHYVWI